MDSIHEVLNPWAEADPVPLRGISPRLLDLPGKRIGLFSNSKASAVPMLAVVEDKLRERFDDLAFSRFYGTVGTAASEERARYEKWIKEQDAVVLTVGD